MATIRLDARPIRATLWLTPMMSPYSQTMAKLKKMELKKEKAKVMMDCAKKKLVNGWTVNGEDGEVGEGEEGVDVSDKG